jgi:DNA-binding transcriptional LysR family regulator
MLPKGLTLRGLEVFEALAASGTVAQAARQTGLSQPAVSQQIKALETALGTTLVDHTRRPMRLTRAGDAFLRRAQAALSELRQGQSDLTVMDLSAVSALSLGLIDDFDNDLTPRLVNILAESLTQCRFKLITASSHDIVAALQAGRLDMGVAAVSGVALPGVVEYPLIRDPFILVVPRSAMEQAPERLDDLRPLPFLRYDNAQLIGQQIDQYLAQTGTRFPDRFEVGSHLALMAMVARGIGWAITTPLGYMRAGRFHELVAPYPLPGSDLARTISLFASTEWSEDVPRDLGETVKRLAQEQMIAPALQMAPWLAEEFRLL